MAEYVEDSIKIKVKVQVKDVSFLNLCSGGKTIGEGGVI